MTYRIPNFVSGGRRLAIAVLFAAAPAVALAQDGQEPAAAPEAAAPAATAAPATAPTSPSNAPWLKVCGTDPNTKKEACVLTQEIRAESGQAIASVSLQPTTDPKKFSFGVAVPLGVLMPPGIVINVDGEKRATAHYIICIPSQQKNPPACIAQAAVTDEFVGFLRKGKKLDLVLVMGQGKTVPIEVTLAGFAKTYDGPGLAKAAAENAQKELAKGLQERAEQARKKLIDQQQKELEGEAPPQQN
jgi:invasion protein IalB